MSTDAWLEAFMSSETFVLVNWNDGVANEWTEAVTGTHAEVDRVLGILKEQGARTRTMPMSWFPYDPDLLSVSPVKPIAEFAALDWQDLGDCTCGHGFHIDLCKGTGATLDPMYQVPPDEACVCETFREVD